MWPPPAPPLPDAVVTNSSLEDALYKMHSALRDDILSMHFSLMKHIMETQELIEEKVGPLTTRLAAVESQVATLNLLLKNS